MDDNGFVTIEFWKDSIKGDFSIMPKNLAPIPGSEKIAKFHTSYTLKLSGLNDANCKAELVAALEKVAHAHAHRTPLPSPARCI